MSEPTASVWPSIMNTSSGCSASTRRIASATAASRACCSGATSHEPESKVMELMSIRRMRSRSATL